MWRIDGSEGRYVEYDEDGAEADDLTRVELDEMDGSSVPVTPTGPFYSERYDGDPLWLFLAARLVLPAPLQISGIPPRVPSTGPAAPGVVY